MAADFFITEFAVVCPAGGSKGTVEVDGRAGVQEDGGGQEGATLRGQLHRAPPAVLQ